MKKKILSFILTGAMLLSALPATIFASADADVHDHDHDHDVATIAKNDCPGANEDHYLDNCTNYKEIATYKSTTCDEPSYTIYECNVCHKQFADNFVKNSHVWQDVPGTGKDATCTEKGRSPDQVCQVCGDTHEGGETDAKGHKWIVDNTTDKDGWKDDPGTDATCSANRQSRKCKVCGAVEYRNDEHNWQFQSVKTEPVHAKSDGVAIYECADCHATKEVKIEATEHDWTEWTKKTDGDCYKKATSTCQCKICKETETREDDYEHHFAVAAQADATCTKYGYTVYVCDTCGFRKVDMVDPSGHSKAENAEENSDLYHAATCTKPAEYLCQNEGCNIWVPEGDPLGHDAVPVEIPAYCGRKGLTFSYCKRDGCEDGTETLVTMVNSDPLTGNGAGKGEGKFFTTDADFKDYQDVRIITSTVKVIDGYDASNHLWDNAVIQTPADCHHSGKKVVYCRYCSAYKTETVDQLKHSWMTNEDGTPKVVESEKVTCTHDGYEKYECALCGDKIIQKTYPKSEVLKESYPSVEKAREVHKNLTNIEEKREATCTVLGITTAKCTDCGEIILITVTKHHENDGKFDGKGEAPAVAPNCTTPGSTEKFICIYCNQLVGGDPIDATGHHYEKKDDKVEPNCTDKGKAEKWVCTNENCPGDGKNERAVDPDPDHNGHEIPANGHKFTIKVDGVAPTCTTDGARAYSQCSVCEAFEKDKDGNDLDGSTIPALGHNDDEAVLNVDDCTKPKLTKRLCKRCGREIIEGNEYTPAAHKTHAFPKWGDLASDCEVDNTYTHKCNNCAVTESKTIPATGHHNKAGDLILTECKDLTAASAQKDRVCRDCGKPIAPPTHDYTTIKVKPTCTEEGGDVHLCRVCHHTEPIPGTTVGPQGHTYDRDPDQKPITDIPSTFAATGKKVWKCGDCGATKEVIIPVKGMGHADPKKDYAGIQLLMEATNADVGGVEFVDSSTVAVKISLGSYMGLDIWGVQLKLTYDEDVLTFVKSEFVTDTLISRQTVGVMKDAKGNPTGELNINANTPNSQGKTQNTHIQGTEDLVVLYFKINLIEDWNVTGPVERVGKDTEISVKNFKTLDKASNEKEVDGTSTTVTFHPFLDPTMDGSVDIADLLMLNQIINGELGDVEYSAAGDVNKDGYIDIFDLLAINRYINGELTYEEVAALSEN